MIFLTLVDALDLIVYFFCFLKTVLTTSRNVEVSIVVLIVGRVLRTGVNPSNVFVVGISAISLVLVSP